jgi:hypothetical protein
MYPASYFVNRPVQWPQQMMWCCFPQQQLGASTQGADMRMHYPNCGTQDPSMAMGAAAFWSQQAAFHGAMLGFPGCMMPCVVDPSEPWCTTGNSSPHAESAESQVSPTVLFLLDDR